MAVVREPFDVGFPQVPVSFCAFVGESSILVLSDGRCESKCGGNAGEKCGGNAGEKCNDRCKGEEIVAYREPSGTLVLVMVMHQSEPFLASDYEINELSEEVPLTFTLNTHYYSPMYRLKAMREVIEALMVKYDYPKVRIKLQVFYSDERAFVQNPEENEAFWSKEDMEYVHPSSFPQGGLQGVLQGVSGSVYPRAFLELMKKAAEVFTLLPVNKLYTAEQIQMLIRD